MLLKKRLFSSQSSMLVTNNWLELGRHFDSQHCSSNCWITSNKSQKLPKNIVHQLQQVGRTNHNTIKSIHNTVKKRTTLNYFSYVNIIIEYMFHLSFVNLRHFLWGKTTGCLKYIFEVFEVFKFSLKDLGSTLTKVLLKN